MRAMKVFLPILLVLVMASVAQAQAIVKIGYIDSQAILTQDPAAMEAQQQFEADMTRYRAEVQQMGEELQQLIDQYEQQQAMLSEAAKANREEEIRLKQTQYQDRIQELEQQAGLRQAELVEPVMERISAIIDEIRAEGGYSMIFDVAAQGIISADPTLDLTPEVVRRLQAVAQTATNPGGTGQR
ncbi:OmpH family outer membrane protein [Gemmatimonadota bacterium]